MLESISCPSCSTHYGLRPERVHSGLRRAQCYKCAHLFDIHDVVSRLLGPAAVAEEPIATDAIQAEDFLDLDISVLASPETTLEVASESPALSLSDLDSTEDEIFDKTLLIDPSPDSSPSLPEDDGQDGSGGFASAKDAIAKLLGNTPPAVPAQDRRLGHGSNSNSMDVEATLNALEHTLGGSPIPSLSEVGPSSQESSSGSTVRLSSAELQAAMAAGAPALPLPQAPTVAVPIKIKAPVVEAPTSALDTNLMKVQLGTETVQNVNLDQLTAWVEQGRVQEFHMVARQFSDNWIEAGKVPSLRPVFERLRRMNQPSDSSRESFGSPHETAPVKKGLFGWMSGRN